MRYRPRRSNRERALAQLRGYWEPQDVSNYQHSVSDAVGKAMKGLGLDERFHEEQVFEAWAELVDDFIFQNARPIALQRRVLQIQVLHSSIHYELERMKGQILKKMQERFGPKRIQSIRFRLG